jgi:hypothetical protein
MAVVAKSSGPNCRTTASWFLPPGHEEREERELAMMTMMRERLTRKLMKWVAKETGVRKGWCSIALLHKAGWSETPAVRVFDFPFDAYS